MTNQFDISFDVSALRDRLVDAPSKIRREVGIELYQFAEEVMADSVERVPVDTGALMNTGKVLPPEESGDEISVSMGYGDESVGYAVYVHENLEDVNWTRPGSGPKFLENPLKERQGKLPGRLTDAVKRGFE